MSDLKCFYAGKALTARTREERDALPDAAKKELEAIPYADVQFSHLVTAGRNSRDARRDSYVASVKFDKFHLSLGFKLDKDGNQYALAYVYDARSGYIPNQFTVQRHVRLVKVHYPANGSLAEVTRIYCEAFLAPGLVLVQRLDDGLHDDFLALLDSLKADAAFAKKWEWYSREADSAEKPDEPKADPEAE